MVSGCDGSVAEVALAPAVAALAALLDVAGRWVGMEGEISSDLLHPVTQGVAHVGENLGEGFAEFFFGAGGDARDGIAGLMVEGRYGSEHPLIGDVVELIAILSRGLLADARVDVVEVVLLRVGHGLPRFDHREESGLHALVGFGDAGFDSAVEGILEAAEGSSCSTVTFCASSECAESMRERVSSRERWSSAVKPSRSWASVLNFVDKGGGGGFGGLGEKGT